LRGPVLREAYTILGFTNVLKDEIPVDAEYREFLNIIENSGLRLMDTLNSLLDLAKLRAGIMEVNPEKIDIYHQCEEEATKLQDLASEKGLELNVIRPNRSLFVDVDVHALSRVFHNLVSNAIKFTEAGKVEIEFYEMEKTVAMHVRDTGIGIDAKFLPDLFDAFIQESDGLSRTHEGTGLGLAICSGLMPLMNATISVESTKGVGSTFTVAIPKADLPEARRVRVKGMGSGASA
jgi:signal transduction histidine kinase